MRALCLAFLVSAASGFGRTHQDGLSDAVAARSLLGPELWSRVVRIDNSEDRGSAARTPYPRTTYGLVFELSGILWFYCDANGTQSLSVKAGAAEHDKLNLAPLLRLIMPRMASWSWVDSPGGVDPAAKAQAPNSCFIECLALLERMADAPGEPFSPRLLSYYIDTPFGPLGHTVLVLRGREGTTAVDPDDPGSPVRIPAPADADAKSIARFLRGGDVASARTLEIDPFAMSRRDRNWTALAGPVLPTS
jgi:hypothetical protein